MPGINPFGNFRLPGSSRRPAAPAAAAGNAAASKVPDKAPQLPPPALPTAQNPQGLRRDPQGRRDSLDGANPEMQRFMDEALRRPMPDPRSNDPMDQLAWRAQIQQFGKIQLDARKAVETPRPTAQDMHLRMKYGPDQTPDLLFESIHAMPKPHQDFMYGTAGVDALPDAPAQKRPQLGAGWTFPKAGPASQAPNPPPVLDPKEFDHVSRFMAKHDPAPTPQVPPTQAGPSRPPAVPPNGTTSTQGHPMIIIPDL